MNRKSVVALVALLGTVVAGCGGASPKAAEQAPQGSAAQQPLPVKIGYVNLLQFAPAIVAEKNGLFAKHGLQATVSSFANGPAAFKALGAREVDVAYAGVPVAAAWVSQGLPIKIIAKTSEGKFTLLTRPDTGIKSAADLKGKKVGGPGKGSGADQILRGQILKSANLKPEVDVTIVDAQSPNLEQLLETKQVDAIFVGEPFATFATLRGKAVVLETPDPALVLIVRDELVKEKPDLVRRVLKAHVEAVRELGEKQAATNELLAKHFNVAAIGAHNPEKIIAEARKRSGWAYQITDADKKSFQRFIDIGVELGAVKSKVVLESILELRFLSEVK